MGYFEDCKAAFKAAKTEDDWKAASLRLDDLDFNALSTREQTELCRIENDTLERVISAEDQQWAAPV